MLENTRSVRISKNVCYKRFEIIFAEIIINYPQMSSDLFVVFSGVQKRNSFVIALPFR